MTNDTLPHCSTCGTEITPEQAALSILRADGAKPRCKDCITRELTHQLTHPKYSAFRVKFTIDEEASFEESNGEARPLTEAEYATNQYRGCPDHPRRHETSKTENGRAWCSCGKEYADIPYDEYLAYYGNPDRHVYLGCVVEGRCSCCGSWGTVESLWGIDMMDDSPELQAITIDTWYSPDEVTTKGYLGDEARQLLREARRS